MTTNPFHRRVERRNAGHTPWGNSICCAAFNLIQLPYTLFIRIPVVKTADGRLYCDRLWALDLRLHCDYIKQLSLCCPVIDSSQSDSLNDLEDITDLPILNLYPLRMDKGLKSVILNFIPNFLCVARACANSKIVHSDGAGWAFPLSFYILLLRPFYRFTWLIVIESSFWILHQGQKKSVQALINYYVHQCLLPTCVRSADAKIFTSTYYCDYFLKKREHVLISPATWIEQESLVPTSVLLDRSNGHQDPRTRFVFPSRLIEAKGVHVLLDAIRILENGQAPISITIIGDGDLQKVCSDFALQKHGLVDLKYHTPMPYGEKFNSFLRQFDMAIVANLGSEQPRIVYDVFGQGLGLIASDTPGIRDIVESGKNAILFPSGNARALAEAITNCAKKSPEVLQMGLEGLHYVKGKTHVRMHQDRMVFLKKIVDPVQS